LKTKSLQPDRLAFYSYAHVPWIKGNGQRGFNDEDIPKMIKRERFMKQVKLLSENSYHEIGMDHFALETDSLYDAFQNGTLP
jgi:oxygen-independent coproporphyrinogen-3 oxidase